MLKDIEDLNAYINGHSDKDFIRLLRRYWKGFPKTILVEALIERGKKNKIVILSKIFEDALIMPRGLLQQTLQEMSREDLKELLHHTSLEVLTEILLDMPQDLLGKVLLELPKDIVCRLRRELTERSLIDQTREKIEECLAELKLCYQMHRLSLQDKERPVSSLRSLAVSSILNASNRSIVGQGVTPLSSGYVDRMMMLSPELKDDVYRQGRVSVKIPVMDESAEFSFTKSPSLDYRPQLDLLSLASIAPGYEGVFKRVLLEKCGNN